MEIKFRCPTCDRKLEVDASLSGTAQECPNCHIEVTIPAPVLGPGLVLGGYEIQRSLGRGAMGEVFLATQLSMGREVALKILHAQAVTGSDFVDRFLHEVRLAAQLEHPNIVTAIDAGEDSGIYWFAMAYVQGTPLDARLNECGPLPEKDVLNIGIKIANALDYAWKSRQILHRDIKPANIMLGNDGEPMLMDMGIAKNVREDSSLTATGMAMGTPHYMSPEQARGVRDLDFRADMYSLGATMYHLIVGEVPFTGGSAVEVVAKHLNDPLPPVLSRKPEITESCALIIEKMMEKDRKHRFRDWESCVTAMRRSLRGVPVNVVMARAARLASEELAHIHGGAGRKTPQGKVAGDSTGSRKQKPRRAARVLGQVTWVLSILVIVLLLAIWLRQRYYTRTSADTAGDTSVDAVAVPAAETPTASPDPASLPVNGTTVTRDDINRVPPSPEQVEPVSGNIPGTNPPEAASGSVAGQPPAGEGKNEGVNPEEGSQAGAEKKEKSEDGVMPSMKMKTALDDEMNAILQHALPKPATAETPPGDPGRPGSNSESPPETIKATGAAAGENESKAETAKPASVPEVKENTVSAQLPRLLGEISADLLRQSFATALATWNAGKGTVAAELAPEQFASLDALVTSVVFMNQRILDGFRPDIGQTVTIHFREGKQKFLVKSISPKGVKGYEIHPHGSIGRTFATRELNAKEKYRRLGNEERPDLQLMRALLLAEAELYDSAMDKIRDMPNPLAQALLTELTRLKQ